MGIYDDESFKCRRCGACCGPHYVSPKESATIDIYLEEHTLEKRDPESLFDKCPYFQDHSCIIYPVRPIVCKLMGLTDLMPCSQGCNPDRAISKEEASEMLQRFII